MKILIAGGGIGGLTLAGFLRQRGIASEVVERAPSWAPVGAGISLAFNAMRLMRELGIEQRIADRGFEVRGGVIASASGRKLSVASFDAIAKVHGPTIAVHRADLHDALLLAVDKSKVRLGIAAECLVQESERVQVTFSDESSDDFDLVVGADGIGSNVRTSLWDDVQRRYSGYTCWRFVVDTDVGVSEPWEMWGRGKRFGFAPIGGGRTYCFATFNAPAASNELAQITIDAFRNLYREFRGPVPSILSALAPDHKLVHGDLEEVRLSEWVKGRVVLIGDAAHATTPNMGQGAAMAIEDAFVLAEELAKPQPAEDALAAYQSRRMPRVHEIQHRSWNFGRLAQSDSALAGFVRNTAVRLTPSSAAMRGLERLLSKPI